MRYSWSINEERFHDGGETIEEAIAAAMQDDPDCETFYVGESVAPKPPEQTWDAVDWLESVSGQDEFCNDFASDWDNSTTEQRAELETAVRAVMAEWLDRHGLRPRFWVVENVTRYRVVDGVPELV